MTLERQFPQQGHKVREESHPPALARPDWSGYSCQEAVRSLESLTIKQIWERMRMEHLWKSEIIFSFLLKQQRWSSENLKGKLARSLGQVGKYRTGVGKHSPEDVYNVHPCAQKTKTKTHRCFHGQQRLFTSDFSLEIAEADETQPTCHLLCCGPKLFY